MLVTRDWLLEIRNQPLEARVQKPEIKFEQPPILVILQPMNYLNRISINPNKRSGKPCIRNLRITVSDILSYLASGMSTSEILADFPELEPEDIQAALAFAAERENRLLTA